MTRYEGTNLICQVWQDSCSIQIEVLVDSVLTVPFYMYKKLHFGSHNSNSRQTVTLVTLTFYRQRTFSFDYNISQPCNRKISCFWLHGKVIWVYSQVSTWCLLINFVHRAFTSWTSSLASFFSSYAGNTSPTRTTGFWPSWFLDSGLLGHWILALWITGLWPPGSLDYSFLAYWLIFWNALFSLLSSNYSELRIRTTFSGFYCSWHWLVYNSSF